MAFEGLAEKLQSVFSKLTGRGKLSEADIKAAMREVRLALLEADVNYLVVKKFVKNVSEKAVGEQVLQSLTPGQQVIKIVRDEMTELLGGTRSTIKFASAPPTVILMAGLQGAGKTTMVKLLMRFYDVNSGCIKVDGENVKDFERRNLREAFGMVLQDTWLFKGTIMENIRYGRLDATDEEVIAAAKAANADHFIRTLPGGYAMELNEEASNVSQGQKQLLTIARAILADNRIMILDEATSSVDTRTEQHIQDAMANLMKGRTSFVIAHRLSTIRDADVILVMKDGDIIEQGNHKQLLAQNGFYAQLYNSQFEG